MLSSANIEHEITLALIGLVSIIVLVITAILALAQIKRKSKSDVFPTLKIEWDQHQIKKTS